MTMKDKVILIFIILISFKGFSQDKPLPSPEAYFSAIIVSDIESSIDWYSNVFGFKVLSNVESEERGFKQANLKCDNILVELLELKSALTPENVLENYPKGSKINGFFKFGFIVSEFDAWVEHLKELNVEFHGNVVIDPLVNKKMLIVKDPDGNRIQIFEK